MAELTKPSLVLPYSAQYTSGSILAGLAFAFGGSLILFAIFCSLRPLHNVVYAPKVKYSDDKSKPKQLDKHPFRWIKEVLFNSNEDDYLEKCGLDAVVYLRFSKMCRNIFIVISVIAALIILPINVIYNRKSPKASTLGTSDIFILTTPILITGKITIVHVVLAYLFDFIVFYFLSTNYKHIVKRRKEVFQKEECQNLLFRRTLLITEIPEDFASNDQQLRFLMYNIDTRRHVQSATMGRDISQLTKDIKSYNKRVLQLESVISKYFRNPHNLPSRRPTKRVFNGDNLSDVCQKTDAISYLFKDILSLVNSISSERNNIGAKPTLTYGIVSYTNIQDCNAIAAEFANGEFKSEEFNTILAPRPEAIIWENIAISKDARRTKQIWGNIFFLALTILWIAPNAFLGAFLSQMSRIGVLWPPFARFIDDYPILFSILQGIGAPLVTGLIFLVMPAIMRKMTHWQGNITKHDRELSVTRKLYCFFVFNNIFIFTLFSVAWAIVVQIIEIVKTEDSLDFNKVKDKIAISYKISTAIMGVSSFWVMYILRINVGAVLDLLQLFSLIWRGFQRHFMSPTPRQQMLWTAPQHFAYASYYTWLLFYSTIALSFTIIQPIVGLVVAFYFSLDILYKKYGLMYIFVTKTESDGLFWPLLADSFLFATAFGNIGLFVVVLAQGGWRIAVGMGPLFLFIIYFKCVILADYHNDFSFFLRSEEELRNVRYDPSASTLEQWYQNPVIDCNLMVPMVHDKVKDILPQILKNNFNAEGNESNQRAPSSVNNQDIELVNISSRNTLDRRRRDQGSTFVHNPEVNVESSSVALCQATIAKVTAQINSILKFVSEQDLDYKHLKLIERMHASVSNNVDTFNDAAIAQALGQEENSAYNNTYSGPGGPSTTNIGRHTLRPVSYANITSSNAWLSEAMQREADVIYGPPNTESLPRINFGNAVYGQHQDGTSWTSSTDRFQVVDLHGHGDLEASRSRENLLNDRAPTARQWN